MADDVKDIAIYTGSEWTSLVGLAAGVVDVKLPIYDSDEPAKSDGQDYGATVELSAPDDFQFSIATRDPTNVFDFAFVERMKILNTGAFFDVDVSTDTVHTKAVSAPGTADLTFSTGGTTHFTLRPDGHIGQGYAGQANINYAIYQGFGVSDQEQLGFLAAPKFDGQPAIRCVSVESQPVFTDVVANNVVHFNARDDRGGNKPFAGKQTGFLVGALTKSSTQNIGFDSAVSGVDNFAFLASGSSPSQFNGGIITASVRGPVGTDASVTLGGQATLKAGDGSEYVPTDSASIATKSYCDSIAGGPTYDDTQIKADLNAEALARATADTTLQDNIDAKIWVGTTASYLQIPPRDILPTTLYCLTD